MYVITYPCWDKGYSMLIKEATNIYQCIASKEYETQTDIYKYLSIYIIYKDLEEQPKRQL